MICNILPGIIYCDPAQNSQTVELSCLLLNHNLHAELWYEYEYEYCSLTWYFGWIQVNGEIYNHEELRKRLPDHKFRTGSDCDVIAHLVSTDYLENPFTLFILY